MNIKLQQKLFKKFPKIFKQRKLSIRESCMPWGCECGDGWYNLIYSLCENIQSYIDSNKKFNSEITQIEFTQLKEKYGTLRIYSSGGCEKIDGMIWLAEGLSAKICENCGSQDKVTQTKGWITAMCQKCMFNMKLIHKIGERMKKCLLYKIYLNEKLENNCPTCAFNDKKNNKCRYDNYFPGMKTGKDLTNEKN